MDFNTTDDKEFRQYVEGRPYIKLGATVQGGYIIAYTVADRFEQIFKELGRSFSNIYPHIYGLMDRSSLDAAGIINVHRTPNMDLRGRGVLLGFIDTGIDFANESFRYEDGTTKIAAIWDQTIPGKPPADQYMGTEYTRADINEALKAEDPLELVPHRDTVGHGTFLASVAGGRGQDEYIGAAPDSDIIMVKVRKAREYFINFMGYSRKNDEIFSSSDVLLGIKYILDKAAQLGRPVAVCLGMGSNGGGHDGATILEQYLYAISSESGVAVCVPVGNEANARHHTRGTVAKEGTTAEFQINCGENTAAFMLNVIMSPHDRMLVSVVSPTGDVVSRIPASIETFEKKLALERSVVRVRYSFGESNNILIVIDAPTKGIWTVRLYGEIILDGTFHSWLALPQFIDGEVEFLTPDPNFTAVTPATAVGPITSGAYNPRDGSLYISSSWGPSRVGLMNPDLAAPGVNIGGVLPDGYGTMTGTSVATAITTGCCAIALQWAILYKNDTSMNTFKLRTMLIRGCERTPETTYPNNRWGYGKLNLYNSFNVVKRL